MPQVTIGDVPYRIGSTDEPYALQNNGTTDIYLGTGPNVSPLQYDRLLDVGGELSWPAGHELFAVVDKLLTGQLTYINNGAQGTPGATRISGPVTVTGNVNLSGPVTVAGIVAVSGSVEVSGPVAIQGTVPITGDVNIAGGSIAIDGGVDINGNVNITNPEINVGGSVETKNSVVELFQGYADIPAQPVLIETSLDQYNSLIISWMEYIPTLAGNDVFSIYVERYTLSGDQTYFVLSRDDFFANAAGTGTIVLPILGGITKIGIVNPYGLAGGFTKITVLATAAVLPRSYRSINAAQGKGPFGTVVSDYEPNKATFLDLITRNAGESVTYFMASHSGKARVYIVKTGAAVVSGIDIKPVINDYFLFFAETIPAGTQELEYDVIFPECPVRFTFTGSTTDCRIRMTIIWE